MKYFITIVLTLSSITQQLSAQQNKLKLGFLGFPTQSGFGIGDVGYERLNKELNSSWQLHFSASGGAIAMDAGTESRKWITVEKTFYRNTITKKITWSYSFFLEAGSRLKKPGKISYSPDKILRETKLFEINPGACLGIQIRLGRKWGVESQIGPKLIFANGDNYYSNSIINQNYLEPENYFKAGFRVTGGFYYQF